MTAVITQTTFKPNPGADMSSIRKIVKEAAVIWRKHGAEVSLSMVSNGEIGNMTFSCRYESFEKYGKCAGAVYADPAFQTWSAKATASGLNSWVRSNILREISLN